MDPQLGKILPEQSVSAKQCRKQISDSHLLSREIGRLKVYDNNATTQPLMNKFKENIENAPMNLNHNNNVINNMANKASINCFQGCLFKKYGGYPWRNTRRRISDMYDPITVVGLHQEIEEFFKYMSPTPEEQFVRLNLIANLKHIILSLWPNSKVELFGSFQTSLYLPTSDIDMVVLGELGNQPLRTLEEALLHSGICDPKNVKVLDKAKVPIVKFNDRHSDIKVDVSFNTKNGVNSVDLIKHYCVKFPAMHKLVLVLKQFLLQYNLNEVYFGGISSYSLILMCVSFFQLHPNKEMCASEYNLGMLLIDFFELYGQRFNYAKLAISVKEGGSYILKDDLYRGMLKNHYPSILSIEDPLTPGNDVARGSFGAFQVQMAFKHAYSILIEAVKSRNDTNKFSTLGKIIRVTDRIIDYRLWFGWIVPRTNQSANSDESDCREFEQIQNRLIGKSMVPFGLQVN